MNANHGMFSVAYALSAVATGLAREAGFGPAVIFGGTAVIVGNLVADLLYGVVDPRIKY